MFAYPTEAYTTGSCESERELRALVADGSLQAAIESYGIGLRSTSVLMTLAYARVWSRNIGEGLATPSLNWTRTRWEEVLDDLVRERLGKYRCLDCGNFHNGVPGLNDVVFVAKDTCTECMGPSEEVV